MPLPPGTELIGVAAITGLLGVWGKYRFVAKADYKDDKSATGKIHTEIFKELKVITKHMGAVEKYMEMKK